MTRDEAVPYCRDLRMRIDALTTWEVGFLESLEAVIRSGFASLSPLQADKLREIHARLYAHPPGGLTSTEDDLWR